MSEIKKRVLSFILILSMIAGLCPMEGKEVKADSSSATLQNMGEVGTLTVGTKTKKGNWWKISVGEQDVFCLTLGYTCHRGDVYNSENTSYSSDSSGKDKLRAYIGYWYDKTKKRSNKAYVFSQALLWSVEEGDTSETKLKAVIETMKSNTGYYSSTSVDSLYDEIFKQSGTFTVSVKIWKYSGSGSHRQELMEIVASENKDFNPKHLSWEKVYRQRITLYKVDEDGAPVPGVEFKLSAEDLDELYYFKANGMGNPESGDVDEDADNFELTLKTDSDGKIAFRFNYELQTKEYYYYSDSDLENMTDADKKKEKSKLDEEGYLYDSTLTKDGAESLASHDLDDQLKKIQNHYKITEICTGNDNLLVDSEYAEGKEIVVDGEHSWFKDEVTGEWPDTQSGQYENYDKAYKITVTDKYKKVTVTVEKKDGYSSDKKAHGDATLEGAVFQLYEDAACTKSATVFDSTGKKKQADSYFVKDGKFETDYMRCGTTYYLKEVEAPNGYLASTEVFPITADGKNYSVEFTPDSSSITVENQPILGKIALRKYMSDGSAGIIPIEKNAQFQVYLKSAGSYDKADDYSRDTITTNEEGYGCTKNLYYGEYTVHQVSTGGEDTEKVADFDVIIETPNRSEPYLYNLNNPVFKAYLRVVKKDGNTEKTVLKPGTTYQIYQVNQSTGEETLVTQEYSDGHCMQKVDSFQTDDTGTILTVSTLSSGKYRIYEKQGAEGYHISNAYIEVEISSDENNYTSETDVNGKTYTVVTADYINQETYGKLSVKKTGEQLKNFENGVFTYELTYLNGVQFEIYAREDIPTQDNQGTNWFEKDELVGTLTTGEGVKFEKTCGGICESTVDENGMVTVHLPLGKYRVVEKKTIYGYILSKQEWNVDFQWENDKNEYVIDASGQTDENGVLSVKNERARAAVSLGKVDAVDRAGVSDALFGLYTKDAIYNSSGDKIVEADALLGTVRTEKDGKADFDLDLPLMSELNSGDYYIQELDAPDGYYCSGEKQSVHLEYKDDSTEVISYYGEIEDTPTSVEIDKKSVAGGEEVPGCQLRVDDSDGNMVIQWISGQKDSIQISEQAEKLGYQNLKGELDEKGNLHIRGLFKDKKYVLTEVRPADGYVTADSIAFQVTQNQVVTMYDDTTKVEFSKLASDTKKLLTGAKIGVYDSKGSEIYSFTTKKNLPVQLYGMLKVGETYTFREIKAPSSYSKAEDVSFTVEDTGEIQKVVMTDKKLVIKKKEKTPTTKLSTKVPKGGTTPKQPKTGSSDVVLLAVVLMILSGGSFFIGVRKRLRIRF